MRPQTDPLLLAAAMLCLAASGSGASGAATAVLLPADVLMLGSTTNEKVAVATVMT